MTGTAEQLLLWLIEAVKRSETQGKTYELKEKKKHRTLTQNAYYWVLLSKVADVMRMSKTECHNRMLRDYGQLQTVGGQAIRCMIPDTDEAEAKALHMATVHLKPTSQVRCMADGVIYRTYCVLRGSHEYSTKEMTVLTDGLIQEAKALGIETLPPAELEHMRQLELERERRKDAQKDKGMRDPEGREAEGV